MASRSKQLSAEVAAALAKGSAHPEATPSDWKKRITDIKKRFYAASPGDQQKALAEEHKAAQLGLRAAEKQAATTRPSFVTDTNLFALTQVVVRYGGPEFPIRLPAVDAPHIKRCIAAGLVEIVDGSRARLTRDGRARVADRLVQDIAREERWTPRENTFVPSPEKRAELLVKDVAERDVKVRRLEEVLKKLA